MKPDRQFKVATFYHPRERPVCRSHIGAYTLWYNPEWPHVIEYVVEAKNGTEAKRKAITLRLEHERAQVSP